VWVYQRMTQSPSMAGITLKFITENSCHSSGLSPTSVAAFTKVVCDKTPDENVLGIHYIGPNAGEVMQGYGVAMKDGLKFKKLTDTVGIHPTSAEEIVTLSISKSSGEDGEFLFVARSRL
jgi:hypothetical protein